jgi:hypothetical protein
MAKPEEPNADCVFHTAFDQQQNYNDSKSAILKPFPRFTGMQAACCSVSSPLHVVIMVTAFEPAEQLGQQQNQSWWKRYQSWFSPYMPLDSKQQCQQPCSNTALLKTTVQSSVTAAVSRVSKWLGL